MKISLIIFMLTAHLFGMALPENAPFPGGVIVQEVESEVPPEAYVGKRQLMVLPADGKDRYFIVADITNLLINITLIQCL